MRVLVTGISGRLGRAIAEQLCAQGHEVLGIDKRPWLDAPPGVEVVATDLRKREAEDVFRTWRPEALVHMATVTHLHSADSERHRLSLGGTKAAIEHCDRYGVGCAVFVGRHTYYGATPESPLYHSEDEPPMTGEDFPELADLVAADLYAGSALWRYPAIDTAVLRLCYTLGPTHHGTLAEFLRGPKVPTVLGFDPLFQFMHESDAVRAVILALTRRLRGVFNVAGPAPLPISTLIQETGREQVAIPESMLPLLLGKFGLPKLPRGAINHLKYPIVIDTAPFREKAGFAHEFDEYDTLQAFCQGPLAN
ncbi:MAG TPA: NAD-dependent epimerase/dehydratase family protein [Polyangiaceae bacterium]|jgi:UDP-glucose 4-epimerase|nr:NAD-dependent epimerase/dehydratase family protein [Polyangiaceae bacterium]